MLGDEKIFTVWKFLYLKGTVKDRYFSILIKLIRYIYISYNLTFHPK